jgi:hypothetical protein
MVDFGGSIVASGNGINGISLNSKAGLDLDAGSQVQASNNSADGVHLEQLSVMTIFNNPSSPVIPEPRFSLHKAIRAPASTSSPIPKFSWTTLPPFRCRAMPRQAYL